MKLILMPPFRHKTKTGRTINFKSKESYNRWNKSRRTATKNRKIRVQKEDNLRRKTLTKPDAQRKFAKRSKRSKATDQRTRSKKTFKSPNKLWGSKINRYDVENIDTPASEQKKPGRKRKPGPRPKLKKRK